MSFYKAIGITGTYAGGEVVYDQIRLAPWEEEWNSDINTFSATLSQTPSKIVYTILYPAGFESIESSYNSNRRYIMCLFGDGSYNTKTVPLFGVTAYGGMRNIDMANSFSEVYLTFSGRTVTYHGENEIYYAIGNISVTLCLDVYYMV